jgi:hypothetical protein
MRLCKKVFAAFGGRIFFETDVFFMILLRKIMKNTSVSNFNLARSAEKILFTQPHIFYTTSPNKILRGEAADTPGK